MESIRWMVEAAGKVGILRIVLNGSFVSDIMEPNDVDCVLLIPDDSLDDTCVMAFADGFPFLEISVVPQLVFDRMVNRFFATDRFNRAKGMIEVVKWN